MANQPDQEEHDKSHRYFAIEANNEAWALIEKPFSPADTVALLSAAHTAYYHWFALGNELNTMRATMLLAEAHALAGSGETALGLGYTMRDYFVNQADTPDWELAFTHAIFAHCALAAGNRTLHATAYQLANEAMAAIVDPEDKKIVAATFAQVPKP